MFDSMKNPLDNILYEDSLNQTDSRLICKAFLGNVQLIGGVMVIVEQTPPMEMNFLFQGKRNAFHDFRRP